LYNTRTLWNTPFPIMLPRNNHVEHISTFLSNAFRSFASSIWTMRFLCLRSSLSVRIISLICETNALSVWNSWLWNQLDVLTQMCSAGTHLPKLELDRQGNSPYPTERHCRLCLLLWLYSPLFGFAAFSVSWSYAQSVGLLGRGISPSQGRYLHTEQHQHRINAHNTDIHALGGIRTQSQRSSERRQFMPYTARLLWSALSPIFSIKLALLSIKAS
jgi:hypothetical protein